MTGSIVTHEYTDDNGETIYRTRIGYGPTATGECNIRSADFLTAYNALPSNNNEMGDSFEILLEDGEKPTNLLFIDSTGAPLGVQDRHCDYAGESNSEIFDTSGSRSLALKFAFVDDTSY